MFNKIKGCKVAAMALGLVLMSAATSQAFAAVGCFNPSAAGADNSDYFFPCYIPHK